MAGAGTAVAAAMAAAIHGADASAWYSSLLLPVMIAIVAVSGAAWGQGLGVRQVVLRGAAVAVGGAALILSPDSAFMWGVAAFVLSVGLGFAGRTPGPRLLASIAAGTGAAFLACHVFDSVLFSTEFAAAPTWLTSVVAGVGFTIVLPLALLPQHVMLFGDAVDRKYRAVDAANEEVGNLAARSYDLWRSADPELTDDDPNRAVLQEAVERVLDAAVSWQTIAGGASASKAAALDARVDVIEAKLEVAKDEQVRSELRNALRALVKQRDYLSDIKGQCERIAARMHSYVATLEQLRLAMVTVESTRASQHSPELSELLVQLDSVELGA